MRLVLAVLTLSGFNFSIWAILSLTRFFAEKRIFKAIGMAIVSVMAALLLIMALAADLGSLRAESGVHSLFLLFSAFLSWFLLAAIAGYLTARLEPKKETESAIAAGIIFWFTQTIAVFIALGERYFGLPIITKILVSGVIFLFPILSALLGGFIAAFVNKKKTRETEARQKQKENRISVHEVATLTPAHNEEATIARTIESLAKVVPKENIYVASDASTDRTVEIVREFGANVLDIQPNRGKAGALQYAIDHFGLVSRYKTLLIIDADSEVNEDYMTRALPLFDDGQVSAVAGHATSKWYPHTLPRYSMFFSAYRVRFYRVLQAIVRYGQTWKYTNVSPIVPGFASMYRTEVLPLIDITAPGLIIEDFNMTFELHHKRLGKIAYDPNVKGITDDPHSLGDYIKQIKRWYLGFWQTVRRHGFWPGLFWFANSLFILEMIVFGIFFLFLPIVFLVMAANGFGTVLIAGTYTLTLLDLLIGVFLVDYLITSIVAVYEKKPVLFLYGLGFTLLRYLDALMFLYALPLAFFTKSEGKWISPKRTIPRPETS